MSMRQEAFAAVRWTSLAMIGRAGIQFLQVLILARLLAPHDFGLFAIIATIIAIANVISDLGISNALIHYQDVTERERSTLYWMNMMCGALLWAAVWALSPLLALFFHEPDLRALLPIAGAGFLALSIGQQLRVMAQKVLRFDRLALIEIATATLGAVIAITMAARGGGAESIVFGSIASAIASSAAAWIFLSGGWRPLLLIDPKAARRFFAYGADTMGMNLINALNMSSDVIVGGRALATAQLGFYSLPRDLCLRLMLIVNPIVTRVGMPMLAKVQDNPALVRHVYRRTLRMTSSVNFPIYAALSLFAPEFVRILFGPNWQSVAPILQIAALAALFRSIGNPLGSLILATGQTRRGLWVSVYVLLTIFPALALGAQFGAVGLAWANLCYFAAQTVILWWFVARPCAGIGFVDYHTQIAVPLLATTIAASVAAALTAPFHDVWPRLLIGCASGGLSYLAASYLINREWLFSALELALPGKKWARA